MINHIFRFAFEELLRRGLKSDVKPLGKADVLRILCPFYKEQLKQLFVELNKKEDNQVMAVKHEDVVEEEF